MPIGLALVGAIAGLLVFNIYPARMFPGDSGTLLIGGSIACLVILNQNMWLMLLTLLFFLPHAIDFFALKMMTNRQDMSQSKSLPYALGRDNRLRIPAEGGRARYDFAKMLIKIFGPMPEWLVVAAIWLIVACNCAFWAILFASFGLV
jgi:UDP-N-acetylglucosamine--dolichyl-phosphate N-acetylglucosaminephosphotransferase